MSDERAPLLPHQPDPALLESFRYIDEMPGKNVRGTLIDCFQLWMKVESPDVLHCIKVGFLGAYLHNARDCICSDSFEQLTRTHLVSIQEIVGDLHNASLMIDDIEDNSKLRRGVPVAHSIFGIPTVINGANYAYFLALEKCHALRNSKAMDVFVGELLNLHRGQGHDILWRDDIKCPTEDQYLEMVKDKTGGLFRLAVGLMQAFATTNQSTNYTPLVDNLALYFQIRDDYINLADEEYMKSKSFCEDLTEGKFSFPIIHCIRSDPNDTRLLSILKKKTEDIEVKRYAQRILSEKGSLKYTIAMCHTLKTQLMEQIVELGGNVPLMKLVELLDIQLQGIQSEVPPRKEPAIDGA